MLCSVWGCRQMRACFRCMLAQDACLHNMHACITCERVCVSVCVCACVCLCVGLPTALRDARLLARVLICICVAACTYGTVESSGNLQAEICPCFGVAGCRCRVRQIYRSRGTHTRCCCALWWCESIYLPPQPPPTCPVHSPAFLCSCPPRLCVCACARACRPRLCVCVSHLSARSFRLCVCVPSVCPSLIPRRAQASRETCLSRGTSTATGPWTGTWWW